MASAEYSGVKGFLCAGWKKNPAYAFQLLFPGQETLIVSAIHYIKGQQASLPTVVNLSVSPAPFPHNSREECLTREKLL